MVSFDIIADNWLSTTGWLQAVFSFIIITPLPIPHHDFMKTWMLFDDYMMDAIFSLTRAEEGRFLSRVIIIYAPAISLAYQNEAATRFFIVVDLMPPWWWDDTTSRRADNYFRRSWMRGWGPRAINRICRQFSILFHAARSRDAA